MAMVKARVSTAELVAGRYRLVDVVHRETNRVSYYGEDTQTERPCLLTQIGLPDDPGADDGRRATSRILRTSERIGLLRPGSVATVVDAVEEAGSLWTVTEWIDGVPLGELLAQQGTFNYVRAARIGLELLDVLEAAHVAGITHGELSPGQVFVRDEGSVVVTGFGLAGATLAPRVAAPSYASPEQARDERIGPASDLWALGAILYTMVEGRPPYRERDRPEATLKGVDRLPLRAPVRSGPLTQAVQGLLRKDSRERLSRPVVRDAFVRVLNEDSETPLHSAPRLRGRRVVAPGWSRRAMVLGTALAVVTVAAAVLVVTSGRPDDSGSSAADTAPGPSTSAGSPTGPSPTPTPSASPTQEATEPGTPTASPSGTAASPSGAADLPPGYTTYTSPDGFSVALPEGWTPVRTQRAGDVAYRVTFSADDDPRRLAVTYSEALGPDPVAVWRDDVQPGLAEQAEFERIGDIEATTYQGYKAADMQWLSERDGTRLRTFGRGFLIADHRGYSLRWTTPADDWDDADNREALDVVLRTFKVSEG
ncbi:serine/threonine protein kinase [Streptomyces sp. NPDC057740]|uniref:serine/threonine protein kinase n=1 Tax=Streptomyces sp. NPDC057740 TaxID=3346234 RepID=UPI0036964603